MIHFLLFEITLHLIVGATFFYVHSFLGLTVIKVK